MSTRKVKDAQDLGSGELIYFKGHAKATYMSDGRTVEDAINDMQEGGGSGEVLKTTEAEILAMGFTKNAGTVTSVIINGNEMSPNADGVVDLGEIGKEVMSAPIDNMAGEYLVNFYSTPMQPDVAYVAEIPINAIYNLDMVAPQTLSATYTLHFRTADTIGIFVFPSNLLWANGEIPTIEPYVNYELSIVATKIADEYIYKAVLTPFKSI